jgi:DNA-binding PucR family transcriptional regulator
MDYIVEKCRESMSIDAIIPRGLTQLKRYDKKYGTNLVQILAVFLRLDMRVAPAARELYLHRNTLTSKISQIRFITRMDFENDPEVRMALMVSLRMLGQI